MKIFTVNQGFDSFMFTVPPGGDGLYYFSLFLYVDIDEVAFFHMRLNDDVICAARPDHGGSGALDYTSGSCSSVVNADAGKSCSSKKNNNWRCLFTGDEVQVVLVGSDDNTPLDVSISLRVNEFNGFRIRARSCDPE